LERFHPDFRQYAGLRAEQRLIKLNNIDKEERLRILLQPFMRNLLSIGTSDVFRSQ